MFRSIIKYSAFLCFIALCSGFSGCTRLPPRPEGMPELCSCSVEVTFGGEKVEGVAVVLTSEDSSNKWNGGGTTDAEGIADMKTGMYYLGIVPGKYKISFAKTVEQEGVRKNGLPKPPLSVIPLKYGPGKSELSVEITKEEKLYKFPLEAGKAELW